MRGFQDVTTEREDFKSENTVNPDTKHAEKVALKSAYRAQMKVGMPLTLLFVLLIISSQVLLQKLEYDFKND